MKVSADRDICIGAGTCVLTAPEVFDQHDDGTVALLAEHFTPAVAERARQAVALCPSGALQLADD